MDKYRGPSGEYPGFQKAVMGPGKMDAVTAYMPYNEDPRFLAITNQHNLCQIRFTVFCRCARELGEDHVRCKYQYFRAQTACMENHLEDWMEHRARGTCPMDILPDRSSMQCRQ